MLLYVASERPRYQNSLGYAGAHGRILDRMLMSAGLSRDDIEVVFADQWVEGRERDAAAVVLGGERATKAVLGWPASPGLWHGSVLPANALSPTGFDSYTSWLVEAPKYVVAHDVVALHKAWELHPLAARDWKKAGQIARNEYCPPNLDSWEWVVNCPHRVVELESESLVVFDTESSPVWMIGFANSKQIHVMNWGRNVAGEAKTLLQNPAIIKVAHNLQYDLAMCKLRFGFDVAPPYFDTYGGMHLLNTALERTLSPGLSARFTNWPYHKWLNNVDAIKYNGLDNVVCYQGAVEIMRQLHERKLDAVSRQDHKLLGALFSMQCTGLKVSEVERARYELQTKQEVEQLERRCDDEARPIIQARLKAFVNPALFYERKTCSCCSGRALHCWRCGGLESKPKKKADYAVLSPGTSHTVAELKQLLPPCAACQAIGKIDVWKVFNPNSHQQVADVLYRGLRIAPRRYKGKETTAAAQLKPLQHKHPLIKLIVETSALRADLTTVSRLTPGADSRLHCVFDPWGTESGRVACRAGLFQPGTNLMNVPKKARRFGIPDTGHFFLYPDLSQVEARAVAVLSQDKELLKAFTEPVNWPGHEKHGTIDSHTVVQQMVSKYVKITRDQAKRVTYAVMYGASGAQLALELTNEAMRKGGGSVSPEQGNAIKEAFFLAFPGVRLWQANIEMELLQTRTLRSLSGRERHWPGRVMGKYGVINEVLKQAWSFKPQEIGATVLALGILDIVEHHSDLLTPLVHVHDACLLQARLDCREDAITVATKALSRNLYGMWFPCTMKCGGNWYEAS